MSCQNLVRWVCAGMLAAGGMAVGAEDAVWRRHAIDDSLRGADGVKLADVNQDQLPDITVGWEESGAVRIYLHPGVERVTEHWPACEVGKAPSVEDAVWVDLNQDGRVDVLASCEGSEQSLQAFFASADQLLKPQSWQAGRIPAAEKLTRWMFGLPVPNAHRPDYVVVGSKSPNGMVGLLTWEDASKINTYQVHKLADAQWIMSLINLDVDRDGDLDIVYSDRKGNKSGVYWL
ncbi:MAG: VCBS repeat-containing protein, partial [Planctomycetales bacterium]|nr:VCBS repeat-containing protein [Planctomycetales bacterium]